MQCVIFSSIQQSTCFCIQLAKCRLSLDLIAEQIILHVSFESDSMMSEVSLSVLPNLPDPCSPHLSFTNEALIQRYKQTSVSSDHGPKRQNISPDNQLMRRLCVEHLF